MNAAPSGRTWDDASSPAAVRLARRYEEAWQAAARGGRRLDPRVFLADAEDAAGARLAILRADLSLRWEAGDRAGAAWYFERFKDLGDDSVVALLYEEFCLREEDGERPDAAAYLARYPHLEEPLRRVLDIHALIGSATATNSIFGSSSMTGFAGNQGVDSQPYPEAGETIAGFYLVEELGRGSFARVFLAKERELADRPVALKVARRGSREPQALARLQHTHIVPVHSVREDRATGLHLLCMPFFGRITLSRLLQDVHKASACPSGRAIVEALDRLTGCQDAASETHARSACRSALASRTYAQAIAWWGARLAEALDHAHDRGILHRDIKPSNVLVNDEGMPMLLDFNLARDGRPAEGGHRAESTFGGTLDYMSPEHLEALADEQSDGVDARSDIYSLGVLLYEAVSGLKPFGPPRKNLPIYDSLLRAASDRRGEPQVRFPQESPVPAPLAAVIRRCLEPEPEDRYGSAGQLAADLRAVADDLPLIHAREPMLSRVGRRLRRNRRGIFLAAGGALALFVLLGAFTIYQVDRQDRYEKAVSLYDAACEAIDAGRFDEARTLLDAAAEGARFKWRDTIRRKVQWGTFSEFGGQLRRRLENLWAGPSMDVLEQNIEFKAKMAGLIGETREYADRLHDGTESLRFRLVGMGEDVPGAVSEMKRLLEPFQVLECREAGVTYERKLALLDADRRTRLKHDVNELLFLWMVGMDGAFRDAARGHGGAKPVDPERVKAALDVCDRALSFAEPREPWLSLRMLLEERGRGMPKAAATPGDARELLLSGEPSNPASVSSPNACFQWGLLNSSEGRRARALEWLQQAVRLNRSSYWYEFYLGYLANKEGLIDDAISHYSAAVACQPDSPWVRFNLARLFRARGRWGLALDDFGKAREEWRGKPDASRVALELGVLHTSLGNFAEAEAEYRAILAETPGTELARAARLNLASLDAESGREQAARSTYDALLREDPADHAARLSRAYLSLRMGRPAESIGDLDVLIKSDQAVAHPGELRGSRAIALLLMKRMDAALEDAASARRLKPCAAADRLYERSLLAAGRFSELDLGRIEEVSLLPISGAWLRSDLRRAASALEVLSQAGRRESYRASLNRAIILSALGEHGEAVATGRRALQATGPSPESYLVLARTLLNAGQARAALQQADAGLVLSPRNADLLEARAGILARMGRKDEALTLLDQVIATAPNPYARAERARVLDAMGRHEKAAADWSNILRSDPEFHSAYLGRARAWMSLRSWDRAIADLEQAATWSHGNLEQESKVLWDYAGCIRQRPDRMARWFSLLDRTARGWLRGGTPASRPTVIAATRG